MQAVGGKQLALREADSRLVELSKKPPCILAVMASDDVSYIFLDEGGDLVFAPHGSRYFTLTGVLMKRPFPLESALTELRFAQQYVVTRCGD